MLQISRQANFEMASAMSMVLMLSGERRLSSSSRDISMDRV